MKPYVKFLRGTFEAFNLLTEKDEDTIYFLFSDDGGNKATAIYLGGKLVTGNATIEGTTELSGLTDVVLSTVQNKDILQYNGKGWVNISIDTLLSQISSSIKYISNVSSDFSVDDDGKLHLISIPSTLDLTKNQTFSKIYSKVSNFEVELAKKVSKADFENELSKLKSSVTWQQF